MQYDVWVGLQTAGSHVIALFQWNYLMSGEHFRKAISKRKAIKFHLLLHRRIAEFARMIQSGCFADPNGNFPIFFEWNENFLQARIEKQESKIHLQLFGFVGSKHIFFAMLIA